MNEAAVKEAVEAIGKMVNSAERSLNQASVGTYVSAGSDKQTIEDALNTIRLHVRYLVFDLEATRRENRYLRHILDNRSRPGNDDNDLPGSS